MTQDILDRMKQQFACKNKAERENYFSAPSGNAEFTNSQLFFNAFTKLKSYKLHLDGEFGRLCCDMEDYLGKSLYSELMNNLTRLRDRRAQEIKTNAPDLLMHVSNMTPEEMGDKLLPRSNLNQFGEKRDDFVFATESNSERDFYALRVNDKEGKNINWKKRANVNGEEKNVFIMEKINKDSYTYFCSKENFFPVVCLDGRFGHEWTANEEVKYSACEKNNIEDIKSRNIIKIIDRDKFSSRDDAFYKSLNNPYKILDILDSSDVLNSNYQRASDLRARLVSKPPCKAQQKANIDITTLKYARALQAETK